MVGVIRGTGANVSIQQAYNSNTVGGGDSYEAMYVSDAFCDEVTVSAYNFAGSHTNNIMYITDILSPWYNAMKVSGKRLGISEISTTSHLGVDKPAWIKDAFYQMAVRFPRIQTICWFMENKKDSEDLDLNTQRERDAFRDAVYMWKDLTKAGEGDIAPPPPVADQNKLAQAKKDYEESLKQKGITRHDVVKSPEAHKKTSQQPQQAQAQMQSGELGPRYHSQMTMTPQQPQPPQMHINMNP